MKVGVTYSDVAALNLRLGTAPQTVDVKAIPAPTVATIITQATGNTWNVGSLAPATGGVLAGIQGPVVIDGGGSKHPVDRYAELGRLRLDRPSRSACSPTRP